jgi:flagellar motor switch protein FliM
VSPQDLARPARAGRRGSPVPYDFRRPLTLPREHVRRLDFAVETFSRQVATQLSTRLRAQVRVTSAGVDQQTYDEYVAGMSSPTVLVTFDSPGFGGAGIVQLATATALNCVDRLLGGPGSDVQPVRPLTDIEVALMTDVVGRALATFAYAFESIMALRPQITGVQHDAQFVQALGASDLVLVANLAIAIEDQEQPATLMLPLDEVASRLEQSSARGRTAEQQRAAAAAGAAVSRAMDDVPVDVSVRFAPLHLDPVELLSLAEGDVLRLSHPAQRPLDIVSAGVTLSRGVAARRGSRLACLVVDAEENPR